MIIPTLAGSDVQLMSEGQGESVILQAVVQCGMNGRMGGSVWKSLSGRTESRFSLLAVKGKKKQGLPIPNGEFSLPKT